MTKYIGFLIGLGIFCAIIVGISFRITGSPGSQKYINLDRKRINDFNSINYSIDSYYRVNGRLPNTLQELENMATLSMKDPETQNPYTYKTESANSFSLCTTFSTNSEDSDINPGYYSVNVIKFSKGYSCIPFSVDSVYLTPTYTPYPTYTPTPTPMPTSVYYPSTTPSPTYGPMPNAY